jgi:hypothetical protein
VLTLKELIIKNNKIKSIINNIHKWFQ